ncbi:MAG: lactate racemase domain-containing protein [Negativicutes bacterium]|nr:lactate racemase domain-containing protein [Negativicutes bacterium]
MSAIDRLLDPIAIPEVIRIRQKFERPVIADVVAELKAKLQAKTALENIRPGQTVAITIGSRGITNMPLLIKTLVEEVKRRGGVPFMVPAMGSHGGATAEGQRDMIIGMGYTEAYIGAPIKSDMDPVQVGTSSNGLPVYFDRNAHAADWTIVANRIKPHTSFRGPIESGLQKMITIGLGKQKGADFCHELGFDSMAANVPLMAEVSLAKANILLGVGVLENPFHESCRIELLDNQEIASLEPALQEEAKRLSPRIHFVKLDAIIIDEIGKNISGTGFDTNVIGRYNSTAASGGPDVKRVAVLDITDVSHGNGNGLGMADFTTKRAFDKFSFEQTYPNSLTSTVPLTVKIPMVLKSDKQAVQACIKSSNRLDKENVTLLRMKNTNDLAELEVSTVLRAYVEDHPQLEVVSEPYKLVFDAKGNLF